MHHNVSLPTTASRLLQWQKTSSPSRAGGSAHKAAADAAPSAGGSGSGGRRSG